MDQLVNIIINQKEYKYQIQSLDGSIILSFTRNQEFFLTITHLDSSKTNWIGTWEENIDFIQLLYKHEISDKGKIKNIEDFKEARVTYEAGPHHINDNIYDAKWIFDRKITLIDTNDFNFYHRKINN